jgi:predicted lipoprotein with Yx(FWY)xxD motif
VPPTDVNVPGAMATSPTGTHGSAPATVPTGTTTLRVGTAGGKTDVLVDQNGCALYLNTSDTNQSTDVSPAAEAVWIPVMAPATAGAGLDQSKVGTFTRPDGIVQATYNGHQLYRFAGDKAPGEANGQGVNGKYFLVGQNGDASQ